MGSVDFDTTPDGAGLFRLAMQVISGWANVEYHIKGLFLNIVGDNPQPACDLFADIRNIGPQIGALTKIANSTLQQKECDILTCVVAEIESVRTERNRIAHSVWGYSPDLPDAALFCTSDDMLDFFIALRLAGQFVKGDWRKTKLGKQGLSFDEATTYIYRRPDFEEVIARMRDRILPFLGFMIDALVVPEENKNSGLRFDGLLEDDEIKNNYEIALKKREQAQKKCIQETPQG
jgi:hypothetical protein